LAADQLSDVGLGKMAGPILYSANPWYSAEIARKFRNGNHFARVCEFFDSTDATAGSAGELIAPSSNPRKIYDDLLQEYRAQEEHSRIRKEHRRKFERLGKQWYSAGELTKDQLDELLASVRAPSWKIWKPVLYVIPRQGIAAGRIKEVPRRDRAGYGPEFQIVDLRSDEFDIVDLSRLVR
jgi:hypothetical protein